MSFHGKVCPRQLSISGTRCVTLDIHGSLRLAEKWQCPRPKMGSSRPFITKHIHKQNDENHYRTPVWNGCPMNLHVGSWSFLPTAHHWNGVPMTGHVGAWACCAHHTTGQIVCSGRIFFCLGTRPRWRRRNAHVGPRLACFPLLVTSW